MAYFHFEDVEELDVMDAFLLFAPNTLHDAPGVIACFFSSNMSGMKQGFQNLGQKCKELPVANEAETV